MITDRFDFLRRAGIFLGESYCESFRGVFLDKLSSLSESSITVPPLLNLLFTIGEYTSSLFISPLFILLLTLFKAEFGLDGDGILIAKLEGVNLFINVEGFNTDDLLEDNGVSVVSLHL